MKKSAKLALPLIVLLATAALLVGLYRATRPTPIIGSKAVSVTVIHGDRTEKVFTYQTDEEYLGALLLGEGLIRGEEGAYGLYIKEVDGEVADFNVNGAYWALYVGEEYATQGIDTTILEDGSQFSLEYTRG